MVYKKVSFMILVIIIMAVLWYYFSDRKEVEVADVVKDEFTSTSTLPMIIENPMQLKSSAFTDGGLIPEKYTCDGENISPPLEIIDVPAEAVSLVLIMDDHDVPKTVRPDGVWDHWVVWNISPSVKKLSEGEKVSGVYGSNTSGAKKYAGPCPPDKEHRYNFSLYAIDADLSLKEGATKAQVLEAMAGHITSEAKLIGRYNRK